MPIPQPGNTPEKPVESDVSGYIGINFKLTYDRLNSELDYINETRNDFEKTAGPQKWISDLAEKHEKALTAVRNFEIDHGDYTFNADLLGDGTLMPVYPREVNPTAFDPMIRLYDEAIKGFNEYFEKHIAVMYPDIVKK